MNTKNWSIKNEIQKRVNLESTYEWALKEEKIILPKYEKTKAPKLNAGVWNMAMNLLNELKP